MGNTCVFCKFSPERVFLETSAAVACFDLYPIAKGHALVMPRTHVGSLYDLPPEEQTALWKLVGEARQELIVRFAPNGFNIGINDGEAAGQTVAHAHIHLIPRYQGDVPDPRGGIRWVIPEKANYWEQTNPRK